MLAWLSYKGEVSKERTPLLAEVRLTDQRICAGGQRPGLPPSALRPWGPGSVC